jgi:hypothetical protein
MNIRANKACVWCGVGFVVLFLAGFWVIGNFVPPPSPSWDAERLAGFYLANSTRIRIGMIISAFAAILIVPWAAAINVQLKRIEGPQAVWGPSQLIGAGMSTLVFEYILFFWVAATFRADRPAEIVQTMNDMGWIPFVGIPGTAMLQAIAIGVAILSDGRPDHRAAPILPRWAGYANLWCALLFVPGAVNVFFKSGPLAWNGIISWYMVLVVFCVWFVVNTVVVLKALNRQAADEAAGAEAAPSEELEALRAEVAAMRADLARLDRGVVGGV